MKKFFKVAGVIVVLAVLGFYLYPGQHKSFDELFHGDETVKKELEYFRTYPVKNVKKDGVVWQYLDIGDAQETLLLLHGMGGAYDIWFQQIKALKNDFRIISVTYPTANSLEEMAAGLLEILDREEIEKVNIVGSSLGGYITQFLIKNHPDRLKKVVVGNSFPPNRQFYNKNKNVAKTLPYIPEWFLMKTFRGNIKSTVMPASNNDPLVEGYLMEQDYGLMSKKQFIARLHCVLQYYDTSHTNDITLDMLIIESDNDPLIPPDLRDSLKLLYPNAAVHTFHEMGHFPYLNAPEEYIDVLRKFLLGDSGANKEQIAAIVRDFYFTGRKKGNVELLAKAFDQYAELITVVDNAEVRTTFQQYLKMVAEKGSVDCKTEILNINIQNDIGIVKTRFDYGSVAFVDYLSFEKKDGQWKIISKLYTQE